MSQSDSPKVTVRVEVVVEGGETKKVTTSSLLSRRIPYSFRYPLPSATIPITQVYPLAGGYYIEAAGSAPLGNGNLPCRVLAQAYPNSALDILDHAYDSPPPTAVKDVPLISGSWSFNRYKGNPIPGSGYDCNPTGSDNSTLMVWYDYGGSPACSGSAPPSYLQVDVTTYHGYYCLGSGSVPVPTPTPSAPAPLTVTFHGSLSRLGSVQLTWEGTHWSANLPHGSGVVHFLRLGQEYNVLLINSSGTLGLSGQESSHTPFTWTGKGKVDGAAGGSFQVTVTE